MSRLSPLWAKNETSAGHGHSGNAMEEGVAPDMSSKSENRGFHMPEPLFAWADPQIPISPPPPLTGKQMGQVHTLNVPPLGYAMEGKVKVFTLIAQPVKRYLTDGRMPDDAIIKEHYRVKGGMHHMSVPKEVKLWGYNGTMPGPTLEATEGDRVRIILKNELPEPTSIHWHGLGRVFCRSSEEV